MAFESDLSVFTDPDVFGQVATAIDHIGRSVTLQVVFDNAGQNLLGGGLVEATGPTALARSTDLADIVHGCLFTVLGVSYRVVQLTPDGTGLTRVDLERAP